MNIERLTPAFKDYIWGGTRLKEKYGKKTDLSPCAESWELSFHKDGESTLADGRTLSTALTAKMLGTNLADFEGFPLLIKLIDAKSDLSVQVHPSDEYALKNENSYGKTEMWYIVDADEGAGIYLGFKESITEEEFKSAIEENRLCDLLNFYPVKAGESYFIPSGTIHAIGKGTLICEIQQNSNLTYRVYDYGRVDKNGKQRELHIEKALKVTNLKKHEKDTPCKDFLGVSRYFTVKRLIGNSEIYADEKSFVALTVTRGEGSVGDLPVKAGETLFVPAGYGSCAILGDLEVIMTEVRKYYIGIDLGGTFIKGGIVSDKGEIVVKDKVPTESEKGSLAVAKNIAALAHSLLKRANMTSSDVVGIGMGVPGMIDGEKGEVVYSNNLGWEHFSISREVEALTGLGVKIANDANVAALGETLFGCGREYKNTVMLTLGTGVGGGIVIGGRLFEGNRSAGAELGHSVILAGGEACTCGRRGCLEAYASATALIRDTKKKMRENPDSAMWRVGSLDKVNGETAFSLKDTDKAAREVVDAYIEKLAIGITNIANVFRPEAVILGGGVSAEGDNLILPLSRQVDRDIFAGEMGPRVKILIAELGNDAGLLGAAALWI